MGNNNPNPMLNEEKINEFLENQRELIEMQRLNNLILLSQNPNVTERLRVTATVDALALIANSKYVSNDLRDIAIKEWNRIKVRAKEMEEESELARQFK